MRRKPSSQLPCVLAIGGLDPGGGAGLAADLRALSAAGAFGCPAIALVTVQSTAGLVACRPLASRLVVAQADEVVRIQRVRAIKLGALGSVSNVRAVAKWLSQLDEVAVVLDPVMMATRGRPHLLDPAGITTMRDRLVPHATLVTANAHEAAALTGLAVTTAAEARLAARALVELGAKAALVKGGHLVGERDAIDVLAVGRRLVLFRSKRLKLPPIHGGGCVLASLIAGRLATHSSSPVTAGQIVDAVRWARRIHQIALRAAADVGGAMRVLAPTRS